MLFLTCIYHYVTNILIVLITKLGAWNVRIIKCTMDAKYSGIDVSFKREDIKWWDMKN